MLPCRRMALLVRDSTSAEQSTSFLVTVLTHLEIESLDSQNLFSPSAVRLENVILPSHSLNLSFPLVHYLLFFLVPLYRVVVLVLEAG